MPTELPVDTGGTDIGKKLWDKHQKNEYTRVNNYKEAVCINCLKVDATSATIADICSECAGKRGREPLLATVSQKMYGLCFFCGDYKFNIEQINGRFCRTCHRRIANVTKAYNKKGGMFKADPFWIKMRKKLGKDWMKLLADGSQNKR